MSSQNSHLQKKIVHTWPTLWTSSQSRSIYARNSHGHAEKYWFKYFFLVTQHIGCHIRSDGRTMFISKNLNVSFIKRVSDTTLQLGLDLSAYPFFHLLLIRTLVYLIDNWDKQLTQDWFFHPGPQMGSFDLNPNTLNKTHKYHHITCNIKSSNRPPRTSPVTLISQMRMARVLIIANDKTFLQPDPQTMNKGYKI